MVVMAMVLWVIMVMTEAHLFLLLVITKPISLEILEREVALAPVVWDVAQALENSGLGIKRLNFSANGIA